MSLPTEMLLTNAVGQKGELGTAQRIGTSGGGGGAEVTPASIVTATGQMDGTQKATTRNNLGAEAKKFVVTVTESGGTYSADKSYGEIADALEAGKTVIVICDYDVYGLSQDNTPSGADGAAIVFTSVPQANTVKTLTVTCVLDVDSWAFATKQLAEAQVNHNIGGATVTITPGANDVYKCGTLTSLTITDPPATGAYSIVFTSGSTATTTTIPSTILGLESFAPEANTIYEINVLDNRAVVGSWAVSST